MLYRDYLIDGGSVDGDTAWRVVDWCASHGADEFNLRVVGVGEHLDRSTVDPLEALAGLAVRSALRDELVAEHPSRWPLTSAGVAALRAIFGTSPFNYPAGSSESWVEDLTLYRSGSPVFEVVSHEQVGILHVTEFEWAELSRMNLVPR